MSVGNLCQPLGQDVIKEFMAKHSGSMDALGEDDDGDVAEEDDDPEAKDDFNDFKAWLDEKSDSGTASAAPKAIATGPLAPEPPTTCPLCKGPRSACYLMINYATHHCIMLGMAHGN